MQVECGEICDFRGLNSDIQLLDPSTSLAKVPETLLERIFLSERICICVILQNSFRARGHAIMVDCKSKSFTFKVPPGTRLGDLKEAIEN